MTKVERKTIGKAIERLMSDDPMGFHDGMELLAKMMGKTPLLDSWKEAKSVPFDMGAKTGRFKWEPKE